MLLNKPHYIEELAVVRSEEELRTAQFAASLAVGVSLETLPKENAGDIRTSADEFGHHIERLNASLKSQVEREEGLDPPKRLLDILSRDPRHARENAQEAMYRGGYVVKIVADQSSGRHGASLDTFIALVEHIDGGS